MTVSGGRGVDETRAGKGRRPPASLSPQQVRLNMPAEMGSGVSVPVAHGDNVVQVGDKRVKIVKVVPVKVIQVSTPAVVIREARIMH